MILTSLMYRVIHFKQYGKTGKSKVKREKIILEKIKVVVNFRLSYSILQKSQSFLDLSLTNSTDRFPDDDPIILST